MPPATDLDRTIGAELTWDEFRASVWDWRQGEHVTLIGPTGRGKTTLELAILPDRDYEIFLGTKRQDDTQAMLTRRMGFKQVADGAEIHADVSKRWMVKPPFPKNANAAQLKAVHARVFREVLMRAFRQGGWTIIADELRYLTEYLGLKDEVELLWLQGRSLKTTMVGGTQRPRHVPLEAYSQASHLFFWHTPDAQDVARVAEIASVSKEQVADIVPRLEGHTVLYVHPATGRMVTTQSPPPTKG